MGIDDAALSTKKSRDILLGIHMDVLGAVELGRATGADSIGAQSLNRLIFDRVACSEVIEVIRGEIYNSLAAR